MKLIRLGWKSKPNAFHALVDDEDYEILSQHCWHVYKHKHTYYARRLKNGKPVFMHREILAISNPTVLVDHKDHNGLNNQRENLREADKFQSNINRRSLVTGSSKYKGVCWNKKRQMWRADICSNKIRRSIGCFISEDAAALAYNNAAIKLHGEFAYLNKVA